MTKSRAEFNPGVELSTLLAEAGGNLTCRRKPKLY
jgi:Ni2+-binding GTPase involved in maturation of urease and hydrogenase